MACKDKYPNLVYPLLRHVGYLFVDQSGTETDGQHIIFMTDKEGNLLPEKKFPSYEKYSKWAIKNRCDYSMGVPDTSKRTPDEWFEKINRIKAKVRQRGC